MNIKSIIKKIFRREKHLLTAKEANIMSRFKIPATLNYGDLLKRKISEIDDVIRDKLVYSDSEKIISIIIPKEQLDLYLDIKKEFTNRGYDCFILTNQNVPNLKENKFLFISWDVYEAPIDIK